MDIWFEGLTLPVSDLADPSGTRLDLDQGAQRSPFGGRIAIRRRRQRPGTAIFPSRHGGNWFLVRAPARPAGPGG